MERKWRHALGPLLEMEITQGLGPVLEVRHRFCPILELKEKRGLSCVLELEGRQKIDIILERESMRRHSPLQELERRRGVGSPVARVEAWAWPLQGA